MNTEDKLLYTSARGWKLVYNVIVVILLWLTQKLRSGHWFFDAVSFTNPPNKAIGADGQQQEQD